MRRREVDSLKLEADEAITTLAKDCAGTPKEGPAKIHAFYHAQKVLDGGGTLSNQTPLVYVDRIFQAELERKKQPPAK